MCFAVSILAMESPDSSCQLEDALIKELSSDQGDPVLERIRELIKTIPVTQKHVERALECSCSLEIFRVLIKEGEGPVNFTFPQKPRYEEEGFSPYNPPLCILAQRCSMRPMALFLSQGADPNQATTYGEKVSEFYDGYAPLHWLGVVTDQQGFRLACAQLLLACGADPCLENKAGQLPWHVASLDPVLSYFLKAAAEVKIQGLTSFGDKDEAIRRILG